MTGMRIKSHKNAFGTHTGSMHSNTWNPNAPRTFWEGIHPAKPANAGVMTGKVIHIEAKKATKTAKTKTKKSRK